MIRSVFVFSFVCISVLGQSPDVGAKKPKAPVEAPKPPPLPPYPEVKAVVETMKKAATYYRRNTSVVGGYPWAWPKDFSIAKGEDFDRPALMMIQPPGTPAMGLAFLRAFQVTDEPIFKQATREAAQSLIWSQLASGGWDSSYDFDPKFARKYHYRRDLEAGDTERGNRHASSTLDDEKTETALLFLVELAHTPEFAGDKDLQKAVKFGFDGLLAAQAPNGGWGQHFDGPSDKTAPVTKARFPAEWPHSWPAVNYAHFYTLNDGNILETIKLLLRAHELTKDERLLNAAKKAGDFLLLAQLPAPQPAWAQQYNRDLEPVWARKFEPPAVSSVESMMSLNALHLLWVATGDEKYHGPMKAALEWLDKSKLADGQYARFYELKTNKPLYCKRETYEITFDDSDLPTHYGFKLNKLQSHIDKLKANLALSREECQRINADPTEPKKWASKAKGQAAKVVEAMNSLSKQGYWSDKDDISCAEFVKHFKALSTYVEAAKKGGDIFEAIRTKENAKAQPETARLQVPPAQRN